MWPCHIRTLTVDSVGPSKGDAYEPGAMLGTDSDWQNELGYEDSVEALKERLMAQGHYQNHEPTVDL